MLKLKWDHSLNVAMHMEALAEHLSLNALQREEAYIAGLLHDAGRFQQYVQYHTFVDSRSEDHALMGCRVIHEQNWLHGLAPRSRKKILSAIAQHSRLNVSKTLDSATQQLVQMLRDCDKIDILRLVAGYYTDPEKARNHDIELDLPDAPELSSRVVETFLNGQLVNKTDLRTVNDFKVLQMGWINDLNFDWTGNNIQQAGYLREILGTLPESDAKRRISQTMAPWFALPRRQ